MENPGIAPSFGWCVRGVMSEETGVLDVLSVKKVACGVQVDGVVDLVDFLGDSPMETVDRQWIVGENYRIWDLPSPFVWSINHSRHVAKSPGGMAAWLTIVKHHSERHFESAA